MFTCVLPVMRMTGIKIDNLLKDPNDLPLDFYTDNWPLMSLMKCMVISTDFVVCDFQYLVLWLYLHVFWYEDKSSHETFGLLKSCHE